MRTAAILPVKSFARAKQRLGASVPDPLRLQLARAMVADVLLALAQTASIERTIIVTREQSVAATAREQGVMVLEDVAESGQSAAAALGVQWALAEGIERVLCVPGDCPALDPEELDALLAGPRRRSRCAAEVVIVPDRHGSGTNGLLLSPPDAIAPSFGPDSCERHRALARAADVAERAAALLAVAGHRHRRRSGGAARAAWRARARAPRTRAVLGQPERTNILPLTTPA